MSKIDWSKFLSREFLVCFAGILLSFTVAILAYMALNGGLIDGGTFVSACIAAGGILVGAAGAFTAGITMQKRGAMSFNQEIVKQTKGRGFPQSGD